MRKIFALDEGTTTPEPCAKEKKAFDDAAKSFADATALVNSTKKSRDIVQDVLDFYDKRKKELAAEKNLITSQKVQKEIDLKAAEALLKQIGKEIDSMLKAYNSSYICGTIILEINPYCVYKYHKILLRIGDEQAQRLVVESLPNQIDILIKQETSLTDQETKLKEKTINETALLKEKQKAYDDAINTEKEARKASDSSENIYNACMKKNLNKNSKLTLNKNLNLNNSCKEIKQKIKTINQKRISIDRKSLNLKYGIDSLPILNINKKTNDFILKNAKKSLMLFENYNNTVPEEFKKDFNTGYDKAKKDLFFYKTERSRINSKIKNIEDNLKNIKVNKTNSKNKLSKLIKKLKDC
jgi:hypothetical protein